MKVADKSTMFSKGLIDLYKSRIKNSDWLWTSHRGFKQGAEENTFGAFKAAEELGFCSFETDLRSTTDGHIVLSHDANLSRISGQSINVEQEKAESLKSITFPSGQKLLFWHEWFDAFKQYRWILDIKPENGLRTTEVLCAHLSQLADSSWIQSNLRFLFWRKHQQDFFQKRFPKAYCLARQSHCYQAAIANIFALPGRGLWVRSGQTYALPPLWMGRGLYTEKIISRYHQRKAQVIAYLPTKFTEIQEAQRAGCDEVLVDVEKLLLNNE